MRSRPPRWRAWRFASTLHFAHLRVEATAAPARSDVERLASAAEDLADDEGTWRDEGLYREVADEILADWRVQAQTAVDRAHAEGGGRASIAMLRRLEGLVAGERDAAGQDHPTCSAEQSRQLRDAGRRLRGLARPRGVWMLVQKFWPSAPCRLWLDAREQTAVQRSCDAVNTAAELRHRQLTAHARRRLLDQWLGNGASPGILHELQKRLPHDEQLLSAFATVLPTPAAESPEGPFELLLLASINDAIDEQGTTVEQWFDQIVAGFGCTAARFARLWWQEGLSIDGRQVRPGDWHRHRPSDVAKAVVRSVRRGLGIFSVDAPANVDDPQSPYDVFATIGLTHPRLRTALRARLEDWIRGAKPYLEVPPIPGAEPRGNWYLFCASEDRPAWLKLLGSRGCGPAPSAGRFDLPHRAIAVLSRFEYGIAAQASLSFIRGVHARNVREARGDRVLPNGQDGGEWRTLSERPDDHEDAAAILEATLRCQLLRPLEGAPTRWAPARREPSLDDLFYEKELHPQWQTAKFFQKLLRHEAFLSFVEVHSSVNGERLRNDDWFYNVMFFRAMDAWALGRLSQADATPFMRWYQAAHSSVALGVSLTLLAEPYRWMRGRTDPFILELRRRRDDRRRRSAQAARDAAAAEHERATAPLRALGRQEEEQSARRRQALNCLRDRLRYDLRLQFNERLHQTALPIAKEDFEAMLAESLAPHDVAEIERRVNSLKRLVESCSQAKKSDSLEEIALDFERRKAEIDRAPYAEDFKQKLKNWLNRQQAQALQHFITQGE